MTNCVRMITMEHMNVAMDADCLIKLTKAGLKEAICDVWHVVIPPLVRDETVTRGRGLPDAEQIQANIDSERIIVAEGNPDGQIKHHIKGEDAVLELFRGGGFDAIASDDARFVRRLRTLAVPHAVPAVLVVRMFRERVLTVEEALDALDALRGHINADQYAVARVIVAGEEGR